MQINNSIEFEFYKNYAEKVAPILEEFEKKRKEKFKKLLLIEIIFAMVEILALALPFLIGVDFSLFFAFFLMIYIFILIGAVIYAYQRNKEFCKELKESCMPKLIKVFNKLEWHHGTVSDYDIRESDIFGEYNSHKDDDCFKGKYNNVKFLVSEAELIQIYRSHKGSSSWTTFKGVIINFSCNKDIKNKTIITTKGDINVKGSNPLGWLMCLGLIAFAVLYLSVPGMLETAKDWFYTILALICGIMGIFFLIFVNKGKEKLDKMTLEDPEFERRYNAYSSDQIEGRYLLTTAFMERFKNLHTVFGSRRAKCSFYNGNKLMIAISTNKNLFEIGNLFFPINNTKQINVFLKEIQAVYKMIDYFKLDQHTGL